MKAYIDEELCTGCGECVDIAPDVFDFSDDEDDVVVVISRRVPVYAEEDCEDAAGSCPTGAINLVD